MLGWSINLFRICGIQLAVHASFVLLLAYFGYEGWQSGGLVGALWSLLLITLFFGCVVLHELGHSLAAMRYGVQVPRILLMPIGGMAEFDRIPRQPSAELVITIAGPAVNFVIVALLLPVVWPDLWSTHPVAAHSLMALLIQLTLANGLMGIFNLLPVFPMDGGRILRALLATRMNYLRATYWAAMTAKVLAPILALLAFFYYDSPLLGVLFIFIFVVGDAEYRQVLRREQEAEHWAEWARRIEVERLRDAGRDEPPPPPFIVHDSSR